MATHVRYCLGRLQDALAIGVLVRRSTRRWVLPGQPTRAAPPLLAGMTARRIHQKMRAGQRFHLAWQDDDRLVGVAAMRDDTHLFQFFVSTRVQGQGIGCQLWQRTMREAAPGGLP